MWRARSILDSTRARIRLCVGCFDAAHGDAGAAGKFLHSGARNIEAVGGVIHSQYIDGATIVSKGPAGAAACTVPPVDKGSAADKREGWEGALGCVAARKKAVAAVAAADGVEAAITLIVAGIKGDANGGSAGAEADEAREDLHSVVVRRGRSRV